MKIKTGLLVATLAGALAGCAGAAGNKELLIIHLQPGQQNPGSIGQASLVGRGDATDVTYSIGGVPNWVSRPLQLFTFIYSGTCEQLSAEPAYAMNNTTQTTRANPGWMVSRQAPVALSELRSEPHALVVRTSPSDRNIQIFCGDIRQQ